VSCAKEAAKRNIKVFVEMSTAEVYDSNQVSAIGMNEGKTHLTKVNNNNKKERFYRILKDSSLDGHCQTQV
jgi:hypothetical protein